MLSTELEWIAVYTNPRAEKKTEQNLTDAGFEAYLPLRRELHTWSDRKKWVDTPLLKSYCFVRIRKTDVSMVRSVTGVSHIVSFRGNIATIPDWQIQTMKDFLAAELDVQIRNTQTLRRGVKVRIHSGPFSGREGMLVSDIDEGNFAVEIDGISMTMLVHIDQDLMEPVVEDTKQQKKKQYFIP